MCFNVSQLLSHYEFSLPLPQELKAQWSREAEAAQADLQAHVDEAEKSLSETQAALAVAQASLEELQDSRDSEVQKLEEQLSQACADRDSAASE